LRPEEERRQFAGVGGSRNVAMTLRAFDAGG
jgi:hypothetical protein